MADASSRQQTRTGRVNHLRHSKFIALRDDKAAKDVRREVKVDHFRDKRKGG
jgi:hypothetical protein